MFFTLQELVRWLRMTAFELWLHVISVLAFSVLAVLKYEAVLNLSWWVIFIPLFACDGLNAYFCVIVFIREYMQVDIKAAFLRFLMSGLSLVLLFLFKLLLCQRLSGQRETSVSEVMGPLFVLLQIVMVRACRTH
ncbi:transmembrane protein 203-like [Littorina saxatilis]|uniref:Transmembrane protein 203 n=1 Tax=Littorina saxatilis TaxID=31220 RepID=A0AAN9G4X5_9CAEN